MQSSWMHFLLQKNADVLFSSFQKPKQKRHRCRNPNKLDINTLTGEERVPVVNKRNGKKVTTGQGLELQATSYPRKKPFYPPSSLRKSNSFLPGCVRVGWGRFPVIWILWQNVFSRWVEPWHLQWRTSPGGWKKIPNLQLLQTGLI